MRYRIATVSLLATIAAIAMSACGSSESAGPRTKNAALVRAKELLVNPTFSSNGGGWLGANGWSGKRAGDVELDTVGNPLVPSYPMYEGCSTGRSNQPSLGGWRADSLTFGPEPFMVSQTVTIPQPSVVQFAVTTEDRPDSDPSTMLYLTIRGNTTKATSGDMTGAAIRSKKIHRLSITTTSPNELVRVDLVSLGGGNPNSPWVPGVSRCFGPTLTNATLTATPTSPTGATSTLGIPGDVTVKTNPVFEVSASCLTRVEPTQIILCKPVESYVLEWMETKASDVKRGTNRVIGTVEGTVAKFGRTIQIDTAVIPARARSLRLNVKFVDGTSTPRGMLSSAINVPFSPRDQLQVVATGPVRTPASCEVTLRSGSIRACQALESWSWQFWNDTAALTQPTTQTDNVDSFALPPGPADATQVLVNLQMLDGSSIKSLMIPYER